MVLALLGVWSSVAVVWFDLVDYDSVIGKLTAYDSDGDGDFDVEDAKILLGLKARPVSVVKRDTETDAHTGQDTVAERTNEQASEHVAANQQASAEPAEANQQAPAEPAEANQQAPAEATAPNEETEDVHTETPSQDVDENDAAVPLPQPVESVQFIPDDSGRPYEGEPDAIDTTGELVEEALPGETVEQQYRRGTSSQLTEETEAEPVSSPEPVLEPEPEPVLEPESEPKEVIELSPEPVLEPSTSPPTQPTDPQSESIQNPETVPERLGTAEPKTEEQIKEKVETKKKKPKLLNTFDKTIKAEINAAEKLRGKGKVEEAVRAFESLVQRYPQSPRCRYGKAQAEDDLAERQRSNELLQQAVNTYREASELPNAPPDLIRATLKRRAERQQFLGRMRGALATLQKLVQIFPEDVSLKNDLGVAHLLIGDNKGAKAVYKEVLSVAPGDGFAKVHYGFILKSENMIAESIPYLREGLESGDPGTDDGRFYFHLGDALQRVGDDSAYQWYELGHQKGHFASVWQRSLYNVEGLKAQPWWTPTDTGYTQLIKTLERNWRTIRDEALAVMDRTTGLFVPEEENLRERGEWGQFTLWQQGRKAVDACRSVPKTCALLDKYPEATGCKRGQIKFSVMQPGTHVWPHTGPTNCRLRLHLGLVIPKTGCRIRCTNQTKEWTEGKVLIFDDSFEHEVWQEAESYRLIFIVDVWHPELSAQQRHTLSPI